MIKSQNSNVKRERRKSLFLREITALVQELSSQEPFVANLYVSKVDISDNSGICYIYMTSFKEPGQEMFDQALPILKLYKPSIRKAFAQRVQTRYAPDLVFVYDKGKEKERRITELLDKVQTELNDESSNDESSD
jgi:ribosome-binding factor A